MSRLGLAFYTGARRAQFLWNSKPFKLFTGRSSRSIVMPTQSHQAEESSRITGYGDRGRVHMEPALAHQLRNRSASANEPNPGRKLVDCEPQTAGPESGSGKDILEMPQRRKKLEDGRKDHARPNADRPGEKKQRRGSQPGLAAAGRPRNRLRRSRRKETSYHMCKSRRAPSEDEIKWFDAWQFHQRSGQLDRVGNADHCAHEHADRNHPQHDERERRHAVGITVDFRVPLKKKPGPATIIRMYIAATASAQK